MNKIIFIATFILLIFNVVAQGATEISWENKSDRVLLNYKSDKNENLLLLYYLDNDTVKIISFSNVYVSEAIKESDVMELDNLLRTDLRTIGLYKSCIVRNKDTFLISSNVINLGKQEKAEIFLNPKFGKHEKLNNVLIRLNRQIFFDYSVYNFIDFKIYPTK